MFELQLCHQLIHLIVHPENETQDLWSLFLVFIEVESGVVGTPKG